MRSISIVIPLLLAACVGPIETRVDSVGVDHFPEEIIMLDAGNLVENQQAKSLVIAALEEMSFAVRPEGGLLLQVTASQRPADLSVFNGKAELSSAAGKKRCATKEYRLGVALTRVSDGTEIYRAHAAEFHCKQTFEAVLPMLVEAALKDIGAPRGSYTVKRPR